MKKHSIVCLKRLLPLGYVVFTLSGCTVAPKLSPDITMNLMNAIMKMTEETAKNGERARDFGKGGDIPFTNRVEDRLTRRTSTLTEGTPVDVSPYLLNINSIALTENGIQHSNSIIEINHVFIEGDGDNDLYIPVYEFDVAVSFKANKKKHKINKTVAACQKYRESAKDRVNKYVKEYAASQMGLDQKDIKDFNVQFMKTRKSKADINFQFENIFIQDIEPCYFQFDAEVEYQKNPTSTSEIKRKINPNDIAVFNNVYRSDLTVTAAAAIDVQAAIWDDACDKGFNDTPLPIINFVKSVKVKQ